jgi:L-alanine-DL-glutamate epimerase-like enolase superfamily enzyme
MSRQFNSYSATVLGFFPGGIAGADGLPPPLPRGERPQIMAAIGGIDIALWDIKGKHAGLPVWRVRAAGFTEGLRVAALAEQHAVMIAPHTAPELHARLVAALPRCGFGVESHGDAARNPLSHHLLVGGPETRDSFVHLNDKPGFGVEIDWDYAKRYAA